jgi:DDE superfamily endonuclease
MGPFSARSYPGHQLLVLAPAAQSCQRAKQEIDYGRRGKGYVFGAFCPKDGAAYTHCYAGRTTVNYVDFLAEVEAWLPGEYERVFVICDNLNVHHAQAVLLFCANHPRWEFVFQPKYAAYLNLIEAWWKTLKSLALAGRRFENWGEVEAAIGAGTGYWNQHRHGYKWGARRRHRRHLRLIGKVQSKQAAEQTTAQAA